jgi:adenylate cyclase
VLFCDIRGFSRISETLAPTVTVSWVRAVLAAMSRCIIKHGGVLVDYVGDEVMAMWGAPEEVANHADRACRAALDMLDQLPALDAEWAALIGEKTHVGIGVNTGHARVGNVGTDRKFKYGPLGATVNLASRVQGATKYLKTDLLITQSTFEALKGNFPLRRLCKVRVVNIDRPVELFQLLRNASATESNLHNTYEEALELFENGKFPKAAALLGHLLNERPDDGPSLLLMSRVVNQLLLQNGEVDPVWELPGK